MSFRSPLFALSGGLHAYVAWRLLTGMWQGGSTGSIAPAPIEPSPAWFTAVLILALLLVVNAVLLPMALPARLAAGERQSDRWAWAGALAMGLFSWLFVLTVLRDVALLLLAAPVGWLTSTLAHRAVDIGRWARASAAAVPLLGLLATVIGLVNARRIAPVVTVEVPIANLPAALHGFTIAQISDIHVGPTIKRPYLGRIVDSVNRIGADMVALTGDLVDGSVAELSAHVGPLAGLRSRHGTYFVTGNHEYYSGALAWVQELRRIGLTVLMNEHVVLRHDGASLVVAGVTDFSAHHFDAGQRSDPVAAIAGAPPEATRLLLAHQPRSADAAERAGFDLQLSGHTHGGQFWPWIHFVRLQQPYVAGLHRLRRLWVYTSRGTGYWGPPSRFGAPSEITRLRLVPQPG